MKDQSIIRGMRYTICLVFAMCLVLLTNVTILVAQIPFSSQPEKAATRAGNAQYQKQNFAEAEVNYKKALEIKNNMPEAAFNLGDAVYEQKRWEEAQKQFQLSAKTNTDPALQAKAFHNLGNTYLEQKKYDDAVTAYKNALKIDPSDMETKYNLAFANAMLQKNQGGGNDKNQDQQKQDDKDQKNNDQQNQDQQNKDQQEKQQGQDKNQQADNKEQQQQAQKPRLSKEEADQLMAALENEEQKVNQQMQKKQMKGVRVRIKKDW